MSILVLYSRIFGHFESLVFFFENGGTNLIPKQSVKMFLVNFPEIQQLSNNFSKKCCYFD